MEREYTIEIKAQTAGKRFSITTEALNPLGLKADDWIWLRVKDISSGKLLFEGNRRMSGGTDIYGPDFQHITANQALKVTVARPR
jgi:hypothetical protein